MFIKKSILLIALCTCITSCIFLTPDEHILAGVENYKEGNYKEAINNFEQVLQRDGTNVIARNNLASVYLRMGEFSDAFFELERVIKLNPNYPEAHYNMGVIYAELYMWQESYSEFEKALNLVSKIRVPSKYKGELYYYMGTCLDELGEWKNAAALLEKASLLRPNDKYSMMRLAYVYYYLGKYTIAEAQVTSLESKGFYVSPVFKKKLASYLDWDNEKRDFGGKRNARRKRKPLEKNKSGIRVE